MKVRIQELNAEAFAKYGSYMSIAEPCGVAIGEKPSEFFRDLLFLRLGACNVVSISTCRVQKRPPLIDVLEYHSRCAEAMIPLDGGILLQVAPASPDNCVKKESIEVFRVPKQTAVVLNYGVWHHAPFADGCETVSIMALLPERTYANDTFLYSFPVQERVEIEE